jgi:DNA-binding transcriptional ArsR family regulator
LRTPHHPATEDITLAGVFHAIGDPVRLELLRRVDEAGELTCGPGDLAIPKSTLSNHWRLLREAGIIHTRLDGVRRWVTLRREDLDARFPGLLDQVLEAAHQETPLRLTR